VKGIVIYKSKYGSARQYAQWIGNDLNFPVVEASVANKERIKEADIVIVGSSIYMGKALIKRWLRRNLRLLAGKQLFIFLVSGTPLNKRFQLEKYASRSIPAAIRGVAHLFFFPGRMVYKRLSWLDRLLLQTGSMLVKKNGQKNIIIDYNELERENVNELVAMANVIINKKKEPLHEPVGSFPL
jgi:menaquinone-dependent protoporphyrinogen IX oxidase